MLEKYKNTTKHNKRIQSGRWSHLAVIAVLILFSSGLFSRCANVQGAPEGGPRDTIPPRVIGMNPSFNSTNLYPKRIVIDFDEYIQLKNQQEEFFTSPFMEVKPTLSYKNKSVIIDIDSPLDSAMTYVFDLGSSVVDNNEGNAMKELRYTFSTGDHIDSLFMSGFAADALSGDTLKGAYVFFYDARLDSEPAYDSLLFNTWDASAVTRTKPDGGFLFPHLKPIDYRIYVMKDNNNNQIYDPGTDEIAFLDSVYNPSKMPSFFMWYDSVRQHVVSEPQLFFRSFKEAPERRQNLSTSSRLTAQQIMLKFSAEHPRIEKFDLHGIDKDRILFENPREGGDSLIYWLNVAPEELPDTILADIVYERPDSAGALYWHEQQLRFVWKKPVQPKEKEKPAAKEKKKKRMSCKERRRLKAQQKELTPEELEEQQALADILGEEGLAADSLKQDSLPPSQMKFTFRNDNPLIPGTPPVMAFDLPVVEFDTAAVVLFRLVEPEKTRTATGGRRRIAQEEVETENVAAEEVPVRMVFKQDSSLIREYTLESEWEDGGKYRLLIPAGTIRTIDGERNDTIDRPFKVAENQEMGSLILNLSNGHEGYEYILQVMDQGGKQVLREVPHLTDGTHEVHYITPATVSMRMIEDRNGNGKWDPGSLVNRVQPEEVRRFYGQEGKDGVELKANMEFDVDVDLKEIFKPRVHVESPEEEHGHEGEEGVEEGIEPEQEGRVSPELEPGRSNLRTSEARVEDYEIVDLKADKKARKATKRAERAERKADKQAEQAERKAAKQAAKKKGEPEEDVIPGEELNYILHERPR